jgi:hypothetical protein
MIKGVIDVVDPKDTARVFYCIELILPIGRCKLTLHSRGGQNSKESYTLVNSYLDTFIKSDPYTRQRG